LKIRIFALAKELGMDSKDLIERCSEAGISVKNSALASISPAEKDALMAHLEGSSGNTATATAIDDRAPAREAVIDRGAKIRNLQAMRPRPQHAEPPPRPRPAPPVDEPETADAGVDDSAGDRDDEVVPSAVARTPAVQPLGDAVDDDTAAGEVDAADETDDEPAPQAGPPKKPAGVSRGDYVSAAGGGGAGRSAVREMKPVGTQDREIRRRKEREKKSTGIVGLAAPPSYTPPAAKKPKEEVKAQKPDVALTPDILKDQSPLKAHLRKRSEEQERGGRKGRGGNLREEATREGAAQRRREEERRRAVRGGRPRSRSRRSKRNEPIDYTASAVVELPITVRSLSEAMGRPTRQLMTTAFQLGTPVKITDSLDEDLAIEIALELGVELEIDRGRDIEGELEDLLATPDPEETLQPRPPIVTILGHVDHGKTSLLDRIRRTNVTAGEAGGITQHIASYQVEHEGKKITFVDTPGHAAFGEMRARGANVTDIIVLVIAADDGVMPQTVECISHAKAAGVPIMVAMNKIDLPDVDEQKVFQGMAQHDILPTDWGGEIEVVRTSAQTGQGIDDLLETILLTAELNEYKANPDRNAIGICLEAFRDEGRGPLAWLVVQRGTLRVGDIMLCGSTYGRIRAIYNDRDEMIDEAPPSTPVKVAGLEDVPGAGDGFYVMEDIESARTAAEDREYAGRSGSLTASRTVLPRSLDDILAAAQAGERQELPLIIKADTPGSIEALKGELQKLDHPEVQVEFLHTGVGGVNESDVMLASATGAVIIAFHVIPEDKAEQTADREGVDIRRFDIIYEVTDTIRRQLEGLLIPERVKVPTGRALVLRVFEISRYGKIAGCRVLNGTIERNNMVQVSRDRTVLNDYAINSLKREKEDVKEVREGMECGILLKDFRDVKEGDLFDAYKIEERQRKLDE
jgi:translation initiation factor IF-2